LKLQFEILILIQFYWNWILLKITFFMFGTELMNRNTIQIKLEFY